MNAPTDGSFPTGFNYTRSDNPNRAALEKALAAVEGGAVAAAFASGVAAAMAVFQTLSPNDHVIAPLEAYHGILRLLGSIFGRWQLAVDFVDHDRSRRARKGGPREHEARLG